MARVDMASEIARIKGAEVVRSFCYMCPWQCPSEVYVKQGKVVYVKGNQDAPNLGSRCAKGMASSWLTVDPDRLKYPLKRVGERGEGKFERISWDDAFTFVAEKLADIKEKYGPEAVVFLCHHDPNGVFAQLFLTQLYGSPNFYTHTAACEQDRRLATITLFGHLFPIPDYAASKYIVLWGVNLFESYQSLFESRALVEAIGNGAKLVVVDPVYTQSAEKAHEWIPIKPGTDAAMALAMCRVIIDENLYDREFVDRWTSGFDDFRVYLREKGYTPAWAEPITGVPAETITRLARELATTKPAVVETFKGCGYYSNGTDACRAIYLLDVVTGNIDGPGNLHLKEFAPVGMPLDIPGEKQAKIEKAPLHVAMGYPLAPDLPAGLLPQAVLEGKPYPVKGIFVHAVNPVMSEINVKLWQQTFRELELAVAIELYMSETARECDLVLPEASFYERAEIRHGLWLGPQVILCQPAVEPVGESKPLYEIVKGLAEKMGYGQYFQWDSWEDWARRVLAALPISLEELKEQGFWNGPIKYFKHKETGFFMTHPTPSAKIEIYSKNFADHGYNPYPEYREHRVIPDKDYPLQLVHSKLAAHCNIITQNIPMLMDIMGENWVELNPQDVAGQGIEDGDYVVLESPSNRMTIKARIKEGVRPGVACVRHGHGFGHWAMGSVARGKGAHCNSLQENFVSFVSGGTPYSECAVKVRRA